MTKGLVRMVVLDAHTVLVVLALLLALLALAVRLLLALFVVLALLRTLVVSSRYSWERQTYGGGTKYSQRPTPGHGTASQAARQLIQVRRHELSLSAS